MKKAETSLDDIAQSIADLSGMMAVELSNIQKTMTGMEIRLTNIETVRLTSIETEMTGIATKQELATLSQKMSAEFAKVHSSIARLEDSNKTQEADIKALYEMIADLQKDVKKLTKNEQQRLADLESFALQVAEQTGIPFIRKRSV